MLRQRGRLVQLRPGRISDRRTKDMLKCGPILHTERYISEGESIEERRRAPEELTELQRLIAEPEGRHLSLEHALSALVYSMNAERALCQVGADGLFSRAPAALL